jgi:hypothetical protein
MIEVTRMNQSWPHYQAQVILPKLVCNYNDMPIQRHVCESSFFFCQWNNYTKPLAGWLGSAFPADSALF